MHTVGHPGASSRQLEAPEAAVRAAVLGAGVTAYSQGEQVRAEESRMSAVELYGMSLSRAGAAAGERMG